MTTPPLEWLVVCESVVAITTHLRDTVEVPSTAATLSGFTKRPTALCGTEIAWDTRLPVTAARCRDCRKKAKLP